MTIGGAVSELDNLLKADDIPFYYKPSIKAVMDTIALSSSEEPNKSEIPISSNVLSSALEKLEKNSKKLEKLENVSTIIDWNNCHTSEQLESISTTNLEVRKFEEIAGRIQEKRF